MSGIVPSVEDGKSAPARRHRTFHLIFSIFAACDYTVCALVGFGAGLAGQVAGWGGRKAWPHIRGYLHQALAPRDNGPPPAPPRMIRNDPESSATSDTSSQPSGRVRRVSRSRPVSRHVMWDPEAGGQSIAGQQLPVTPAPGHQVPVSPASPATSTPITRSTSVPPGSKPSLAKTTTSIGVQTPTANSAGARTSPRAPLPLDSANSVGASATPRAPRGRSTTPRHLRLDSAQPPRSLDSLYTTALTPIRMANRDQEPRPPPQDEQFADLVTPKEEPEDSPKSPK